MSIEHPPSATIAAVSLKLPTFWPVDPEVWFAQVEAQFTTRGITAQRTKFDYVISSLSPEFATEVRDLLLRPPEDTPYDTLKTELVKRTAASEQRKLQQLISGEELGDRKPTQLLLRIQQLLGDKVGTADVPSSSFLRKLFLQRLPSNVRMVLASTDTSMDLNKLAELADKVMDVATPTGTVAHVSDARPDAHPDPPPLPAGVFTPPEVKQLREEVARLTQLVESLTARSRQCSHHSSRPRRSPSPVSPGPLQDSNSLCWYHLKFGDEAQNCRQPCARGLNSQTGH